jgi:hypothetical protein
VLRRSEGTCFSSRSDDEVGGFHARLHEQLTNKGLASPTRGTAMGLGRGHALGRGSQDSTGDPKGSLKAVPHFGDASRFSAASSMREQLTTAPMLSAHCFAVRENRRKLSCRRGGVRCSRIARKIRRRPHSSRTRSMFASRSFDPRARDLRPPQLETACHAAASSFAAGANGSAIGYLRGRPRGRL